MCITNTSQTVCGQSVNRIILNPGVRIQWCHFTRRQIYQVLAAYRLTPDNFTEVCTKDAQGKWEPVFDLLCRLIHCHFPENKQFGVAVRRKLETFVKGLLKNLHERNIIVIYRNLGCPKKQVYWPRHTRNWALPDWDTEFGPPVSPEQQDELGQIMLGGPIPAFLSEQEEQDEGEGPPVSRFASPPVYPAAAAAVATAAVVAAATTPPTPPITPTRPRRRPLPSPDIDPWVQGVVAMDGVTDDTSSVVTDGSSQFTSASSLARGEVLMREVRQLRAVLEHQQQQQQQRQQQQRRRQQQQQQQQDRMSSTESSSSSVTGASSVQGEAFGGRSRSARRRAGKRAGKRAQGD